MAISINLGANVWHWCQNFKLVKSIEISQVILTPYLHFKKIVKLLSSNSTWPCESTSCKYVSRVKGTPIWKCNCVKMLQIIHISPGLHHLNTSFLHMLPFSKGCLERNHSKKMPSGPQYREIVTCFVIRWKQLFSVYVMQSYQAN